MSLTFSENKGWSWKTARGLAGELSDKAVAQELGQSPVVPASQPYNELLLGPGCISSSSFARARAMPTFPGLLGPGQGLPLPSQHPQLFLLDLE